MLMLTSDLSQHVLFYEERVLGKVKEFQTFSMVHLTLRTKIAKPVTACHKVKYED